MQMKDKETLVRNLVNTFNDRDELHEAYKAKMKMIIHHAFSEFSQYAEEAEELGIETINIEDWIDKFVEERCKPAP